MILKWSIKKKSKRLIKVSKFTCKKVRIPRNINIALKQTSFFTHVHSIASRKHLSVPTHNINYLRISTIFTKISKYSSLEAYSAFGTLPLLSAGSKHRAQRQASWAPFNRRCPWQTPQHSPWGYCIFPAVYLLKSWIKFPVLNHSQSFHQ